MDSRLERHPVQSRKSHSRRNVRDSQNHARRRRDQAWAAREAVSRQSRRGARLGPCPRLCRGDVAHFSRRSRTTTCSPPAKITPCANSSRRLSPKWAARSNGPATGLMRRASKPPMSGSGLRRSGLFPANQVELLLGDATKAREKLGWHHKTTFEALVKEMVDADDCRPRRRKRRHRDE